MNTVFQPAGPGGRVVEATVKWFDAGKGFGFVAPSDGGGDAFLHISALEASGQGAVSEGAKITCEIGPGKKGPQVNRVLQVTGGTAAPSRSRGPQGGARGGGREDFSPDDLNMTDAVEVEGSVKWYSPEKGYGFITAHDGGKDIFVHSKFVKRAGLQSLLPDQPLAVMVVTTPKGREARGIRSL
jgi:cold shock protein